MSLICPRSVSTKEAFWNFYSLNKDDVERIIWDACWRHKDSVDPNDMHQDLMLRLYRSGFLKAYDAKQAQLITFFVTRVNGYARHIVTRAIARRRKMDQALCLEFNQTDFEHNAAPELALEPEMENALDNEQIYNHTLSKLTKIQQKILQLYMEGHDIVEIAKVFRVTRNALNDKWNRIKKTICDTVDGVETTRAVYNYLNENAQKRVAAKKISIGNGNGHTKEKKRSLSIDEKKVLTKMFIDVNGQIETDVCIEMKKHVGTDIGIAQVTGYMVGLHARVQQGVIVLRDMNAYKACITAHRKKWSTYQSVKYQNPKFQAKNI